jgi:flagella basal body P-ring formation protein FlgA
MTNPPDDTTSPMPPGGDRIVWYKRTWVIVTAAIVAVIGASILIDLPRPVSNAEDVASQSATLKEINTDVAPCGYAIGETFLIRHDQVNGTLTPTDRQSATRMLTDDQTACSFTNGSIFDLTNNIQVQDTAAGKYVDRMLSVTTTWVTSDALAAVEDIQYLYLHPGDRVKARDLVVQEQALARDRAQAVFDIQQADDLLHSHLPAPNLPVLPATSD